MFRQWLTLVIIVLVYIPVAIESIKNIGAA